MRGTNWVFKQSSLRFVFKGLIVNIIRTPCCNTVWVYKLSKHINVELLLKIGKRRCVCVVECC